MASRFWPLYLSYMSLRKVVLSPCHKINGHNGLGASGRASAFDIALQHVAILQRSAIKGSPSDLRVKWRRRG